MKHPKNTNLIRIIFCFFGTICLIIAFVIYFFNAIDFRLLPLTTEIGLRYSKSKATIIKLYDDFDLGEGLAVFRIETNDKPMELREWNSLPVTYEAGFFYDRVSKQYDLPEIGSGKWKFVGHYDDNHYSLIKGSLCIYDSENNVYYFIREVW